MLANGIALPGPAEFVYSTQQLVDSDRNAKGTVIAQKINRRQLKFDGLYWSYLTCDEWKFIRGLIENFEVNITYWDDYEDRVLTRKFYFGDSSATPFEYDNKNYQVAKPISYKDCKVNIIDMGY